MVGSSISGWAASRWSSILMQRQCLSLPSRWQPHPQSNSRIIFLTFAVFPQTSSFYNKLLLYTYRVFLYSRCSAIGQDLFECRFVAVQHRLDAEMLVYVLPAAMRIYLLHLPILYRRYHLVPFAGVGQNAYLAVLDYLRRRSHGIRHYRRTAGQSFGHHQPKWFFPLDGEEEEARPGEQLPLLFAVHLALVDDVLPVQVGF